MLDTAIREIRRVDKTTRGDTGEYSQFAGMQQTHADGVYIETTWLLDLLTCIVSH
jgi:hypothetical protein